MGKLRIKIILVLIIFVGLLSSFTHDYYVSIANINLKEETNQLQIEIKLDADDIEGVILKEEGEQINLDEISEEERTIVKKYIKNHFAIWVNGASLKVKLIGEELNPDGSFWCYLVSDLPTISQSIKIKNDILLPTFIQQHNIVNLKVKGKVQSHTFIHKHTTHTFKLDAK